MRADHAELEKIIRTGGTLPDELLDVFKKNAARRRSEKADVRRRRFTQYALEVGKEKASGSWRPGPQRSGRSRPGRLSPNPVPADDPPQPLTCDPGYAMIGNSFAPFLWGSQEQPAYNTSPDGTHLSSVMTRLKTGEFSLALFVTSDPATPSGQGMDKGLGFKGVEISATIGQLYVVAGLSSLTVVGQAQLAMNIDESDASRCWQGDAYAVTAGSATITVSEFSLHWNSQRQIESKALGQNSIETDLFGWGAGPFVPGEDPNQAVFSNYSNFTPGPLDLSVPFAHNKDAVYAMVEVDIDVFGFTQMGEANSQGRSAKIDLDYRIADDDDLIVGPEDTSYPSEYNMFPFPSPIILTQTRLCGF